MNDKRDLYAQFRRQRIDHWDKVANTHFPVPGFRNGYHYRLKEFYQFLISPGLRVLELGCATGDLLASLDPGFGVGVDFSIEMLKRAKQRHPGLIFVQGDAHHLSFKEKFDVVVLSDLVNDVWDVQLLLQNLRSILYPHSRIIFNVYSRLWEIPLSIAKRLGFSRPVLEQNWFTVEDLAGLLKLTNFEIVRTSKEILFPCSNPVLNLFFNHFLVKLWPFTHGAVANVIVARPLMKRIAEKTTVSVIVPARNEAGNIKDIVDRVPEMGAGTEILFVEGHSSDDTYDVIRETLAASPEKAYKLMKQKGVGKADAVKLGFDQARGSILMILDADLTVPPEDLPRFYDALISGKGELINGVRLVYPMEKQAMQYLNLLGNKFFSIIFTWLMGQPIKDTLCGTKVLWKDDYLLIKKHRDYFGEFDPFGDFDLLFGAAKLNRKIIDLPIRYRERTYGSTNIKRWKHGYLLLRMVLFAATRLKFV